MIPENTADVISNLISENFPRFTQMGAQLRSLCIDILNCHDETIGAITVIRLNLNPPFNNPRSATAHMHNTGTVSQDS